jgi:hypothetical protein
MAFNPYAGSDGRLLVVLVAADLTLPLPAALTTGTTLLAAGLTSWKVNVSVEGSGTIHHFEGTAATSGVLWGVSVQGGCASWTADVEGFYDGDTTNTSAKFAIGSILEADFLYSKGANFGRKSNTVKVLELTEGTQVKGERATFSAKLEGHGALSAPS